MLFKETWVLLCRADWLSTVGHFWRRNVSSRCSFGTRFVCGTFWARFFNNWAHFKKTFGAFSALNDPGHTDQIGFPCLVETNFSLIPAAGRRNSKKNRTRSVEQKKRRSFEKKKFKNCISVSNFENVIFKIDLLFFLFYRSDFFFSKQRWERWDGWDVTLISPSIQRYLF